jgi:Domain of unknown function (DUF5076)
MASVGNHPIYDALPISNDVLDKGGVELLRVAVVDEELFIVARPDVFPGPGPWGLVLADIARRLASLYAADGQFTEAQVTAAIADSFAFSFRRLGASVARWPARRAPEGKEGAKPAKSARSRAKPRVASRAKSKPSTKVVVRPKGGRAKR